MTTGEKTVETSKKGIPPSSESPAKGLASDRGALGHSSTERQLQAWREAGTGGVKSHHRCQRAEGGGPRSEENERWKR